MLAQKEVNWEEPPIQRWLSTITRENTKNLYTIGFKFYTKYTGLSATEMIKEAQKDWKLPPLQKKDIVLTRLIGFCKYLTTECPTGVGSSKEKTKPGMSSNSAMAYTIAVRSFYNTFGFSVRMRGRAALPNPNVINKKMLLNSELVKRLVDCARTPRDRAIILTLFQSGMDVSTLCSLKYGFPKKDIGFIVDRGFNSYELLDYLKKERIHYIAPLRRDSRLLPPAARMTGTFAYRKRTIASSKRVNRRFGFLYLFEDPKLRGEEESLLLGKVNEGQLTMDEYRKERRLAGVFGILSDLDVEPQMVYEQYKGREEIEQAFDVMKNDLEADRTYLGREDAVRGYFLMVLLAMRIHFKILRRLREKGLVGKVSVREVLFELSKMEMIVEKGGREYLCAIPKRTEQVLSAFSDYIPMA